MIVRELFMNSSRFDELQAQTGATPQMLATRLKQMERNGLLTRRQYSKHPVRYEYKLTPMGEELFPIILAFRSWGERWLKKDNEPLAMHMYHRDCGGEVDLNGVCSVCKTGLPLSDLVARPSEKYAKERSGRKRTRKAD